MSYGRKRTREEVEKDKEEQLRRERAREQANSGLEPPLPCLNKRQRTIKDEDPREVAYQIAMQLLQSFQQGDMLSPQVVSSVEHIMQHTQSLVAFAKRHAPTPYPPTLGLFCVLSSEMLLHLFSYLRPRDLCSARAVCKVFESISREQNLWKAFCYKEFSPIHNTLHIQLGKSWEWLYCAKYVGFSSRERIKDKEVGHFYDITSYERWEGEWKRPTSSLFSRGNLTPNLDGYGLYIDRFNNLFEGYFSDGRLNGFGRQYSSLDRFEYQYQGQWKLGTWHGNGLCNYSDNSKYDGQWENNQKHGDGKMTYPDARRYEGEWKKDKRNGKGTIYWPSGAKYEGIWCDDVMQGGGIFTFNDGQTQLSLATVEEALTVIFQQTSSSSSSSKRDGAGPL